MIVNYRKKFLFIHIQKTAGTSIRKNLLQERGTKYLHYPHTLLKDTTLTKRQQRLFKFAFVRNPWDRLYSWYSMIVSIGPEKTFYNYVLDNCNDFSGFLELTDVIIDDPVEVFKTEIPNVKSIAFNQLDYLTDQKGNVAVDFIGRFENLQEDYDTLCNKLGIKNLPLQHLNKSNRRDYRHAYSSADAEKIYKMYQRDIEYFGYEF
jgi:chondroitin 4-sulfotransferase 11